MKRFQSRLGLAVAGLALLAAPAFAGQRPSQDTGSTPASDRAVDRGSAAGGGSTAGGGGSVASGGSSAGSASTAPSSIASSPSFGAAERSAPMYAEPQHRGGGGSASGGSRRGGESASGGSSHRGGGNNGGDHAVSRGGSSSRGTSKSGDDSTTSSSSGRSTAPSRDNGEAVPSWSRPRGDRPVTGTATERVGPPPDRNGGRYVSRSYNPFYYDPYYYGYGYSPYGSLRYPGFGVGYGYGLGLGWPIFYDPWYDPWYATSGYAGYGYGGMGYNSPTYAGVDQGKIRLKVKPRNAKVYVDGYFVGNVDEFDGVFQKLALNGGRHRVEIKADGYETAEFDVLITPDQTVTYQGELKKIQ